MEEEEQGWLNRWWSCLTAYLTITFPDQKLCLFPLLDAVVCYPENKEFLRKMVLVLIVSLQETEPSLCLWLVRQFLWLEFFFLGNKLQIGLQPVWSSVMAMAGVTSELLLFVLWLPFLLHVHTYRTRPPGLLHKYSSSMCCWWIWHSKTMLLYWECAEWQSCLCMWY